MRRDGRPRLARVLFWSNKHEARQFGWRLYSKNYCPFPREKNTVEMDNYMSTAVTGFGRCIARSNFYWKFYDDGCMHAFILILPFRYQGATKGEVAPHRKAYKQENVRRRGLKMCPPRGSQSHQILVVLPTIAQNKTPSHSCNRDEEEDESRVLI